jgi:hypothetical protein
MPKIQKDKEIKALQDFEDIAARVAIDPLALLPILLEEMQDDSKKHSLQTLLERIQSGEIDATNIEEDMGRVKKAEGGSLLLDDRESYAEGKEVVDRKISKLHI